jgi:hypothetical protein
MAYLLCRKKVGPLDRVSEPWLADFVAALQANGTLKVQENLVLMTTPDCSIFSDAAGSRAHSSTIRVGHPQFKLARLRPAYTND